MTQDTSPAPTVAQRSVAPPRRAKALAFAATAGLILGLGFGVPSSALADEAGNDSWGAGSSSEPGLTSESGAESSPEPSVEPSAEPVPTETPEPSESAAPTPEPEPTPSAQPAPSASIAPEHTERGATAQAATGSVKGTVRSEDGAVLKNALVTVETEYGDRVSRVRTDSKGRYAVSDLKPKEYTVIARAEKRASGWIDQDVTLTVKGGRTLTQNFALKKGATVTGTIKDVNGTPIPFAAVKTRGGTPNATTTADANGRYTMNGFADSSMRVLAVADGYVEAQEYVTLTIRTTSNLDLTLRQTGRVAGTVTDKATGKPIKGIRVYSGGNEDVTDSAGRYHVNNVGLGERYVSFEVDTSSTVRPLPNYLDHYAQFTSTSGVQSRVDIELSPGAVIRGTLKDRKGRLYNTGEYYISASHTVDDEYDDNEVTVASIRVDPDGSYRMVGVPSGSYSLRVMVCTKNSQGKKVCDDPDDHDAAGRASVTAPNVKRVDLAYDAEFFDVSGISVSGKLAVGRTVRAEVRKPLPIPSSWSYRWYRNGKPIGGATKRSYTLKPQDAGTWVTVKYSAKRLHFATLHQTSYRTKKVSKG